MGIFWSNNKVKILGSSTTLVAFVLGAIALRQFGATADSPALLGPTTVRWMSLILGALNVLLGGGTVAAGFANTTRERVAQAAATVAVAEATTARAMETAILAPVPNSPGGN